MPNLLAHFAIDPNVLTLCSKDLWETMDAAERRSLRAGHVRLRKAWSQAGVFIHDGPDAAMSCIGTQIQTLPGDIRKIWKFYLKNREKFRRRSASIDWEGIREENAIESLASVAPELDVACVDDYSAAQFGLSDEVSRMDVSLGDAETVELCRFSDLDQARSFDEAEKVAGNGIAKGFLIETLWRERLGHLADHARQIVIVDRYGTKDGDNISGLWWLIQKISKSKQHCGPKNLTLIAEFTDDAEIEKISNTVSRMCRDRDKSAVREVQLFLTHKSAFRTDSHDRFIRFDSSVCEIGYGVALFSKEKADNASTFTCKPYANFHKKVMKDLKEHAHKDFPQYL